MSARVFKLTSGASLNLTEVGQGPQKLTGYEIYNTAAAARFVKLYWGVPGQFSSSGDKPTVGTDVPNITIQVGATAPARQSYSEGLQNSGNLFLATTVNAADTDATTVSAGDLIISLFYQ